LRSLEVSGLEDVEGCGEWTAFRLAHQQGNVLRHEDVAVEVELVADAEGFELFFEEDSGAVVIQERAMLVATEGDEG